MRLNDVKMMVSFGDKFVFGLRVSLVLFVCVEVAVEKYVFVVLCSGVCSLLLRRVQVCDQVCSVCVPGCAWCGEMNENTEET